ncbi:DUF819 domain-containing protein [Moraxella catarrhalis]|uniref:DUF819 domain-containing protein n=1 Tax=Moraxella catarrhalis TaxID=480 RepID=A0A198UES3_MORCA|nr:DUF819 family protein [Moraxella catarrhalis]OAU94921.1 DUF819 domain-containing protein [Moraxella catarrhalis]OAU98584.1 DUF819 domain-containing protein [Moraxella catarrhalis]OAU98739.1 DUF819 domain-containing protein [Moraxella catarrhalis]
MQTLIEPNDHLALWTFVMVAATSAIFIEQRFKWASKVPGAVIALLIAIAASNLKIIPTDAPTYDIVWGYIVPLAIPLLLFNTNLQSLVKESWKLLLLFLISSVATMIGAVLGFLVLHNYIPELDKISGIISASYSGGGVNYAAMSAKLSPTESINAATIVADNMMMATYFLVLIAIANMPFVRRVWGSPHTSAVESDFITSNSQTLSEAYWKPSLISLKDIAINLAASMVIVLISFKLSAFLKALLGDSNNIFVDLIINLITDKYLLLTTITFIIVSFFKSSFEKLNGSQELGTYCIYLFFVVIGIPASIGLIITNAPLLFIFVLIVALVNLILTMGIGKIFKFNIEEVVLACNANIGGPTTAAALAISQGWTKLVGPIMVIGTVGYVIGNYLGTIVYFIVTQLG